MNDSNFIAATFVRRGGSHRALDLPGQDHAVARSYAGGVVLAVADGVSIVHGRHSRADIGAYLAAELAAHAAASYLARDPDDLSGAKGQIGSALYHGLRGLWNELHSDASADALVSTLLVAVVSPQHTVVWASGDGYWGVCAPVSARVRADSEIDARRKRIGDGLQAVRGGLHRRFMGPTAVSDSRRSPEVAASRLRLVLSVDGPVTGAWVASDGIDDEPGVAEELERPVYDRNRLAARVVGSDTGDDLGVAWAAALGPNGHVLPDMSRAGGDGHG